MIGNVNVPGASAADLANKVDKVIGKGLSTEDYTTEEKTKLAGLSADDMDCIKNMLYPHIIIVGTANTSFTLTKGMRTINGTVGSDGTTEVLVPEIGTWNISYEYNNEQIQEIIVISSYSNLAYISLDSSILIVPANFSDASWETIIRLAENKQIPSTWNIGDEKDLELISGETITLQIADFFHDETLRGNNAAITFVTKNLLSTLYQFNTSGISESNFSAYTLFNILNEDIYFSIPSDIRSHIKTVNKETCSTNKFFIEPMKLFLLSEIELVGNDIPRNSTFTNEGSQYPIFTNESSRIKKRSNGSGNITNWWIRSVHDSTNVCYVTSSGYISYTNAPNSYYGICFAFCI